MSTSPQQFADKCQKVSANLAKSERVAVTAAGKMAQQTMTAAAAIAGAGGPRGVKVRASQTTSGDHAASLVKWGPNPGWVKILNDRTQPHFIGPRGAGRGQSLKKQNLESGFGRKSARSGRMLLSLLGSGFGSGSAVGAGTRKAINIPGIGPRAWAMHPGTPGKHFVAPANQLAIAAASQEMSQQMVTQFRAAFT